MGTREGTNLFGLEIRAFPDRRNNAEGHAVLINRFSNRTLAGLIRIVVKQIAGIAETMFPVFTFVFFHDGHVGAMMLILYDFRHVSPFLVLSYHLTVKVKNLGRFRSLSLSFCQWFNIAMLFEHLVKLPEYVVKISLMRAE